eukprot:CAMPEP_0198135238 /NCGR_PEP_ID=MMETSP1442-20131203/60486_1 /TAXON_ID= /ORGANISM="Craspedostauros australis, Strain CCMP3328" /LENGTH=258 /DNA_ID=CAMNT_0043796401 /DNA_START=1420 /DNA_END=2193 /DNA_ORIENTATION=-
MVYVSVGSPLHMSFRTHPKHLLASLASQTPALMTRSLIAAFLKAALVHAASPIHAPFSIVKLPRAFPVPACTALQPWRPVHAFLPMKMLATTGDVVSPWDSRTPRSKHALTSLQDPVCTLTLPKMFRTALPQPEPSLHEPGPITLYPTLTAAFGCVEVNWPNILQARSPLQLLRMMVSGNTSRQASSPSHDASLTVITPAEGLVEQALDPTQQSSPHASVTAAPLPVNRFLVATVSNMAAVTSASSLTLSKRAWATAC